MLHKGYDAEAKCLYEISKSVRSGDSNNREAYAARIYFEALFGDGFTRDLPCLENAALNYGYAILLSAVNREIVSRGYLMQLGIHHHSEFNHFNLGCDFMEPFRPIVDEIAIGFDGTELSTEHKRNLQSLLSAEIFYRGGCFTLKSVLGQFVGDCSKVLSQEMQVSELTGYEFIE